MSVDGSSPSGHSLPVRRGLTLAYRLSLLAALLMTCLSLAGLLAPAVVYPTETLRRSFVANDVVNLVVGLPILLGTMWLTRRGRLVGLLGWPGALFYVLYNAVAYVAAMPITVQGGLSMALCVLGACASLLLVSAINGAQVRERLEGAVPARLAGGVLAGFGALFLLRAIGLVAGALTGHQRTVAGAELGTLVADLMTSPISAISGVLLWRRRAPGYVIGPGWLFQASMLFVGLLAVFAIEPLLTAAPFRLEDFVVVLAMGMVCFVPLGLVVRGVVAGDRAA